MVGIGSTDIVGFPTLICWYWVMAGLHLSGQRSMFARLQNIRDLGMADGVRDARGGSRYEPGVSPF